MKHPSEKTLKLMLRMLGGSDASYDCPVNNSNTIEC
jgi:hypothetical protein